MTDVKKIWTYQESKAGKSMVKKRIDSIPGLNCFIGLIGATGARMFQLELDSAALVDKNFQRKFRGVEIQAIPFGQSKTEYTVILLEKELTDIFTLFIEDIIEKLITVSESQQALTLINKRVNYWKKLFSRVTGEVLSAEKQRGLFGELFFLRLLLLNSSDYKEVLHSWSGADSANQDFTRNNTAVEIKTSKANSSSIHISNEQQLDFTAWGHLFLGLISVTESTGNQNSLTGIIEEIKDLVAHDTDLILEFEARLERAGISTDMIKNYNEISYSVSNQRYFQITDGFPVILKRNLPFEEIYNVKYQIDTSSCHSFLVSVEHVLKAIL